MAKLILGFAGQMGCGKGTLAKHVGQNYHASTHRFSTILRDMLDRIHVEQSRENISTLSTVLRKNFGENVFAKSMYHDVQEDLHDIVLVDGVRRMQDLQYLRELDHFKLVYIDADLQKRYERILTRKENTGDDHKTFEQFQRESELETEVQIADLKNYSQYVINNDGNFSELYAQIDEIIKQNI